MKRLAFFLLVGAATFLGATSVALGQTSTPTRTPTTTPTRTPTNGISAIASHAGEFRIAAISQSTVSVQPPSTTGCVTVTILGIQPGDFLEFHPA